MLHGKGGVDVCLCGYERVVESEDPHDLERERWRWKEGLSARTLHFRGIEALLQSIYEALVCAHGISTGGTNQDCSGFVVTYPHHSAKNWRSAKKRYSVVRLCGGNLCGERST